MWYVGTHGGVIGIGYATSRDGLVWTKYPTPVLTPGTAGAWDGADIQLGSVIWNGTRYLMWYRGAGTTSYLNGAVGLAASADGINWVKDSRNPILKPTSVDQSLLTTPFVISTSVGYEMWYAARSTSDSPNSQVSRILYCTSRDGVSWIRWQNPVLIPSSNIQDWDSGALYSPSVIYDGSTYGMWFTGLNRTYLFPKVGFVSSVDGANWNVTSTGPVLTPGGTGSWDSKGVENQDVLLMGGTFMLYYDGFGPDSKPRIGLAYSPSGFTIPEFSNAPFVLLLASATFLPVFLLAKRRK